MGISVNKLWDFIPALTHKGLVCIGVVIDQEP